MGCILLINETDTSTVFRIFLIISHFQFSYAQDGAQENWMSFIIWQLQKTPQLRLNAPRQKSHPKTEAAWKRDSGATRTRDPQLRRLLLYPTELRNRTGMQI